MVVLAIEIEGPEMQMGKISDLDFGVGMIVVG